MSARTSTLGVSLSATLAFVALWNIGETNSFGQSPPPGKIETAAPQTEASSDNTGPSSKNTIESIEQGQTPLSESFAPDWRQWQLQKRRDALRDTEFKFNLRSYYFDREKYDN